MLRSCAAVLIAILVVGALSAQDRELRGVWLTNVASDVYASQASIADAMDSLSAWGFNAIFPVVFNNGHTLYPSPTMTVETGRSVHPAFEGRDVLQELITEAHRVGIEVHPWLEYGFVAAFGQPGPILEAHPEWAGKRLSTGDAVSDDNFYWMSQAHPEVRQFLIDLAVEIATTYDVDGVQLDRVRYGNVYNSGGTCCAASDFGYDDAHLERYRSERNGADPPANPGNTAWKRWRSGVLDSFHAEFYAVVKAAAPHVIVSDAPVVYPYGYDLFMQDWRMWVRDGSLDFVAPQVYRFSASDYERDLRIALNYARQQVNGYDRLYPGMLIRSGDYVADPVLAADFILETRSQGADGHIHWFYEGARLVGPDLADFVYAFPASVPFRSGIWRPEPIVVQEDDALNETAGFGTTVADEEATDGVARSGTSGDRLTYRAEILTPAAYDVFVYALEGEGAASAAVPGSGDPPAAIDQRGDAAPAWLRVGAASFEVGVQDVLVFEHTGGGAVRADAVMLQLNRRLSPDVEVVSSVEEVPPGMQVRLRAYPNPFDASAQVEMDLAEPVRVRVELFDVLGRALPGAEERQAQAGPHRFQVSGDGLPAGVYVLRVIAGSSTDTVTLVRR